MGTSSPIQATQQPQLKGPFRMPTSPAPEFDAELIEFIDDFRKVARNYSPFKGSPFPNGACNWASEILGHLLEEYGFGKWHLVKGLGTGVRGLGQHSHDWLEQNGLMIDATADQFKDDSVFKGMELPLIHRGDSPLSKFFKINELRPMSIVPVHSSALATDRRIRAGLLQLRATRSHPSK